MVSSAQAQPPGPGLPEQAPSVNTERAPTGTAMSAGRGSAHRWRLVAGGPCSGSCIARRRSDALLGRPASDGNAARCGPGVRDTRRTSSGEDEPSARDSTPSPGQHRPQEQGQQQHTPADHSPPDGVLAGRGEHVVRLLGHREQLRLVLDAARAEVVAGVVRRPSAGSARPSPAPRRRPPGCWGCRGGRWRWSAAGAPRPRSTRRRPTAAAPARRTPRRRRRTWRDRLRRHDSPRSE